MTAFDKFWSVYSYKGELYAVEESRAFPYKENSDAFYQASFDTLDEAEEYIKERS
jgi:hypothetical protein